MTMFTERLRRQWQRYKQLFDQLFDWTIALYTIAFFVAAAIYFIRETVLEGHLGLFAVIPVEIYIAVMLIVAAILRPQSMTEEADILFWHRTPMYKQLKRFAFYYSVMIHSFYIAAFIALISIVLFPVYNVSFIGLLQLFVLALSMYLLSAYTRLRFHIWLYRLLMIATVVAYTAFFIINAFYAVLVSICIIIGMVVLYERTAIMTNRFIASMIAYEQAHQHRWQSRIFLVSPQLQQIKPHGHRKKRPRLFTKTIATTPEAALQQLLIKTIWRDTTYRWTLLRLVAISFLPAFFLPYWVGYLLAAACWFALLHFTQSLMQKLQEHHVFRIIHYTEDEWFYAHHHIKNKLTLPLPLLLAVLVTVKLLIFV